MAFAVAGALIAYAGGDPVQSLLQMLSGAIGDVPAAIVAAVTHGKIAVPNELLRSLAKATPLLLSGLAVAIALRAGLFNIGAEGQLLLGGCAAAWVGYSWHGLPPILHVLCALVVGSLVGASWASVAGALKAWRGAHEVIVTIMLNYIAILVTHWLVNGPARDVTSLAPATPRILPTARLWAVEGGANFSAGFALAVLAVPAAAYLLNRTALGFEIRAVGANPDAARSAGISLGRTMVTAMAISGALAGLAGAVEVLGVHRRFLDAFSPGYGFDGIAVALLGNLNPIGVLGSACLFGGLSAGATHMEAYTGTPRQVAGIIQGVVILAVGVRLIASRRPGSGS